MCCSNGGKHQRDPVFTFEDTSTTEWRIHSIWIRNCSNLLITHSGYPSIFRLDFSSEFFHPQKWISTRFILQFPSLSSASHETLFPHLPDIVHTTEYISSSSRGSCVNSKWLARVRRLKHNWTIAVHDAMFPENTGRTEVPFAMRRTPRGKHSSQGGKIGIRRTAGRRETNMVDTPRAVTNDSIDGPGVAEGRLSTSKRNRRGNHRFILVPAPAARSFLPFFLSIKLREISQKMRLSYYYSPSTRCSDWTF